MARMLSPFVALYLLMQLALLPHVLTERARAARARAAADSTAVAARGDSLRVAPFLADPVEPAVPSRR